MQLAATSSKGQNVAPGFVELRPLFRASVRALFGQLAAGDQVGIGLRIPPVDPAQQVVHALLVQRVDIGEIIRA